MAIDLERRPHNGPISDRECLRSALDGEAAPDEEGDLGAAREVVTVEVERVAAKGVRGMQHTVGELVERAARPA